MMGIIMPAAVFGVELMDEGLLVPVIAYYEMWFEVVRMSAKVCIC
jgi:hypothetical protein